MDFKKLKYLLRFAYNKIGLNTAKDGTFVFSVHKALRQTFFLIRNPHSLFFRKKQSNIAIIVRGGIGDHIIASRCIRDLFALIGPQKFDLYCGRVFCGKWIFGENPLVTGIFDERQIKSTALAYDITVDISQFARVYLRNPTTAPEQWKNLYRISEKHYADFKLEIDNFPFLDSHEAEKLLINGIKRYNSPHYFLGLPYGGHRHEIPSTPSNYFTESNFPYITIHNGFDKTLATPTASSTKTYPYYEQVVHLLKVNYPDIKIVQLGVSESSTPIAGVDYSLLDKTTLNESAHIISKALLHIDNEGGLVHIASCFEKTSCVVFGPTSYGFFSYPENINIRPEFCGNCWWFTTDWVTKCPRGFSSPKCLESIPPQIIFEGISKYLKSIQ